MMCWLYVTILSVVLTRSHAGNDPVEVCAVFPKLDLARGSLTTPGNQQECDVNGGEWCPTWYLDPYCVDGCSRYAVSCWLDQTGILYYENCDKRCRWCYNQPVEEMRCQANHYECMMDDRIPVGGSTAITPDENVSYQRNEVYVTKTNCTSMGGLYCPNPEYDYYYTERVYLPWCIKPQPSLAGCLKHSPPPCATYHDNEYDCHSAGCVWCDNPRNPQNCTEAAPSTCGTACCEDQYCIVTENANEWECLYKGCQYCEINGKKLCRFGNSPECLVDHRDNCFYDGSGMNATKEMCHIFSTCRWCPKLGGPNCIVENYPAMCYTVNTECKKRGITDPKTCKLWGCEWCGIDSNVPCIESTTCTDCDCPTRVSCEADTEEKCRLKMCKWCNASNECININSEGVCEVNTPSPCTQECDCGTSFIYDPACTDPNVLNCPRIYSECNTQECPEPECPEGLMKRYESPGMCCMSHTRECGRNTLNDICIAQEVEEAYDGGSVGMRKKRVINGEDILTIKKWPWLAFVRDGISGDFLSGAVIISNTHVLVYGNSPNIEFLGLEINLGTYDILATPAYTTGVSNVTAFGDILAFELDPPLDNFGSCVSPICMPRTERAPPGTKCIIAGWGLTNVSDSLGLPATARDKAVKILPWHICKQAWSGLPNFFNDETHICASLLSGGGDACLFDWGGPLMCQRCQNCAWYLEGVTSRAVGCGEPNAPTIFSRVSYYEDDIGMISAPTEYGTYSCCPE